MKTVVLACAMTVVSLCAAAPGARKPDTGKASPGATLKLGIAAQRMVISVEIESAASSQSVSLMIDLAAPSTLTLRDDVMQGLKLRQGEKTVTLSAPGGFRTSVARDRISPYPGPLDLSRISALNSAALDDRPLAGTLGAGFLQDFDVVVDAQGKELKLLPRGSRQDIAGAHKVRVDKEGRIHMPVAYGQGADGELLLASDDYDSRVDSALDLGDAAVKMSAPRGGEGLNLARYVAFRPTASMTGSSLKSGVGLLEHFRVSIDWSRKQVALLETSPPGDLTADKAFFAAERSGAMAGMAEFMRLYPQSRFYEEAARRLLEGRIAEKADDASIVAATRGYLEAVPNKARSEIALTLSQQMAEKYPERVSMVTGMGEAALEAARGDPKSVERYEIHRLLGTVRLASGDVEGAWKDFLAAVFGLPEDAHINLNLARIYEKQGRLARAFSRYQLTASLAEKTESGLTDAERAEVKSAVERLRDKVPKHDS